MTTTTTTRTPAQREARARQLTRMMPLSDLVKAARTADEAPVGDPQRLMLVWLVDELERRAGGLNDNPADPDAWKRMDAALDRMRGDYLGALLDTFPQLTA
jgi:hypothetical protein